MADTRTLLDTTILIDFFRKKKKAKSVLYQLIDRYNFCLSVISVFEIEIGLRTEEHRRDYEILMENIEVLPIDMECVREAVRIYTHLKSKNQLIELADLLISATATRYSLALTTLNQKHFTNIDDLVALVEL